MDYKILKIRLPSNTAGTAKAAGLPNITGEITDFFGATMRKNGAYGGFASGAFYAGNKKARMNPNVGAEDSSICFSASRSSNVYGNSSTVQPPALTMRYIIKY